MTGRGIARWDRPVGASHGPYIPVPRPLAWADMGLPPWGERNNATSKLTLWVQSGL